MALKVTLTAAEHATLADPLKAEYKLESDGSYSLDLGGLFVSERDPTTIFSALDNERNEHKKTKAHLDRLEKEAKDAKAAAELAEAQKTGDIEKVKEAFTKQLDDAKKEFQKQVDDQRKAVESQQKATAEQFKVAEANKIATELFGTRAPLALPHILAGMNAIPGETPRIEFLNAAGQPDLAATPESFKKSFLTNPLFAGIVVASNASGGSANDGTKSVSPTKADGTAKGFNDYHPAELVEIRKTNPGEYERLKAERDSARATV